MYLNTWAIYLALIVLLITLPLVSIFLNLFNAPGPSWDHLQQNVLLKYITNSLLLILGVGSISVLLGVSTAWLVSTCEFKGRRFFSWALILPLAIPSYIIAYTYAGIFDYTGLIQQGYRLLIPNQPFHFDIMNIYGVIIILAFVLYPYVFATARASFLNQSAALIESGRVLGNSPWQIFFKIALPLSRPAIVAGTTLVIMEVLNDYGAVKYFGIPTFTTGIFRAWFSLGDIQSAIYLAALLMVIVFVMMMIEQWQRGNKQYEQISQNNQLTARYKLTTSKSVLAFTACLIPFLIGFAFPIIQLLYWAGKTFSDVIDVAFLELVLNSFTVAFLAAVTVVFIAIILVYAVKLNPGILAEFLARLANIGYVIPGAVVAIGVMLPLLKFDKLIAKGLENYFSMNSGLIISGSLFMLVFACLVRFLAVAFNPIDSGFSKIGWRFTDAARILGLTPGKSLMKVNLPLMKGALLSALLLVFVDVMKELPLTLILRPFNFDTLATRAFELASDEMVAESSNAALVIVMVGIVPIIILSKLISKTSPFRANPY